MTDFVDIPIDPEPWRRCRCASNWFDPVDQYYARCPLPATQEDGFCDHCRADVCPIPEQHGHQCCLSVDPIKARFFVKQDAPCAPAHPSDLRYMRGIALKEGKT